MEPAPKILIVEDDEDDLFLTQRILRKAGMEQVCHLPDGRKTIEFLSGPGPRPDVMLVDLKIPEVTGHEILEWMSRRDELKGIRTYVLSSSGEARDRSRAEAAGAKGYFEKPLTAADVARIRAEAQS